MRGGMPTFVLFDGALKLDEWKLKNYFLVFELGIAPRNPDGPTTRFSGKLLITPGMGFIPYAVQENARFLLRLDAQNKLFHRNFHATLNLISK